MCFNLMKAFPVSLLSAYSSVSVKTAYLHPHVVDGLLQFKVIIIFIFSICATIFITFDFCIIFFYEPSHYNMGIQSLW